MNRSKLKAIRRNRKSLDATAAAGRKVPQHYASIKLQPSADEQDNSTGSPVNENYNKSVPAANPLSKMSNATIHICTGAHASMDNT